MSGDAQMQRHLSAEHLSEFIDAGAPAVFGLDGEPTTFLLIDPAAGRVSLRVRSDGDIGVNLAPYRHISAAQVHYEGERYVELRIDCPGAMLEAYPILCSLVDRVQLNGVDLETATVDVLDNFRRLLQGLGRITESDETGLHGELMFLTQLIPLMGPGTAVSSWTGADPEEHDFALPNVDVEVKTTTSERRIHTIHGLSQLVPNPGRELRLVSIQLTAGGPAGITLGERIDAVRSIVKQPGDRAVLDTLLEQRGWYDEQRTLYTRRLSLRTEPAAYRTGGSFPAITPELLGKAGVAIQRIDHVQYSIDLTGLVLDTDPPFPLEGMR